MRVEPQPTPLPARGFTLIELAACLVVLALLTSIAVLSLQSLRKNAGLRTVVDQIVSLDRQTRQRAESHGNPWRIVIDLDRQELWSEPADRTGSEPESPRLRLPSTVRLESMSTASHRIGSSLNTTGQGTVIVSIRGLSPTYRLRLTRSGPPSQTNPQATHLLISGGSGQLHLSTHPLNEPSQPDIFETLRPTGHDAG